MLCKVLLAFTDKNTGCSYSPGDTFTCDEHRFNELPEYYLTEIEEDEPQHQEVHLPKKEKNKE